MTEIEEIDHCEDSVEIPVRGVNSKLLPQDDDVDCVNIGNGADLKVHLKALLQDIIPTRIDNDDYLLWLSNRVTASDHALLVLRPPVFVPENIYKRNPYLLEKGDFVSELFEGSNYVLPVNFDTEFQTQNISDIFNPLLKAKARQIVTCQVSDALNEHPALFVHPDLAVYAQNKKFGGSLDDHLSAKITHSLFRNDCLIVDYLRQLGYEVVLTDEGYHENDTTTPVLTLSLYGFFLVADLLPFFQGDLLKRVLSFISEEKIKHDRRLRINQDKESQESQEVFKSWIEKDSLRLPCYIVIDGLQFSLALNLMDVVGAQGKVKLETFSENVGLPMVFKGLMGDDISRMKDSYFKDAFRFTAYATGDLSVYPALKAHHQNLAQMVRDISAPSYASTRFGLTIGSITNKILDCKRLHYLSLPPSCLFMKDHKVFYESCLGKAFFKNINKEEHPAHAQLKVEGGRCRNNRPVLARFDGAVCDLDIKGAYSGVMMDTPYFFGSPTLITFKQPIELKAKKSLAGIFENNPISLGDVLKKYKDKLRAKHWTMRITTSENLNHPQELIASWDEYKFENIKCDTESYHETGELDYDSGWTKILSRQIINGLLTSDLLDVILQYWSPSARDEFLKKVHVDTLMFYDPALEIKESHEFVEHVRVCVETEESPSLWHGILLKDLGVEFMRNKRDEYLKSDPLNALYKLVTNTIYGVTVSKYFPAMNPITANNITACVRTLVYLSEKIFGFYQTITDGGAFDLNAVHTPKRKGIIRLDKLFTSYKLSDQEMNQKLDMKRCGLGGHKWNLLPFNEQSMILERDGVSHVVVDDEHQKEDDNEIKKEVNRLSLSHLKACFPKMPLFDNPHLAFEMKEFYQKTSLHGSSNYGFWVEGKAKKIKMRGYENKRHLAFTLNDQGVLILADDYTEDCPPSHWIHQQIIHNPRSVMFPLPFIKSEVLKTARFVKMNSPTVILPGDHLIKTGKPCYFSESQHTFQTKEQRKHWISYKEKLKRKYGISYELFYLNEDSALNYQEMLEDIDRMISEGLGCHSAEEIKKYFNAHRNLVRIFAKHPRLIMIKTAQEAMKKRIMNFYAIDEKSFDKAIAIAEDVEFDEDIEVDENDPRFR